MKMLKCNPLLLKLGERSAGNRGSRQFLSVLHGQSPYVLK